MSVLPHAPRPTPRAKAAPIEASPAAARARHAAGGLVLEAHPVPLADPLVLWEALPDEPAAFWRAPSGERFSGVGEALAITAGGRSRFQSLADQARELLAGLELPFEGSLRLIGGLAFDPEGGRSSLWQDFGPARFVLPRFTYLPGTREARLVVVRRPDDDPGALEARVAHLREALETNAPVAPQGLWPAHIERLPRETWSHWIDRVQAAIGSGVVSKVVLARESVLDLPVPLSARAILSRLAAEHQDCFCFGLRSARREGAPQAAFVGASPERLVRLDRRRVQVDALAGTAGVPGRGASSSALERAAEGLRTSLKDRAEHEYVVEAIRQALTPLCPILEIAKVPEVRQLRHVLHLHTPIEGLLSRDAHLLEVAAALHPTPAVAGTPTEEARAILGACEGRDRGWYAGPIGWFDAEGSGELCVGLRSGLLRGRQAHLFAGAGVVSGSRADAEYEETRLKERALCQALGVAP
ncbi:MAG: isochorismate synthase [Deltaproteobacteria bacterium]|nr:isochorismate synthase [Deltaproteobacteria bacterium]